MASQLNGSVLRAFAILALFDDEHPERTTAEVAASLALGHVTAHRFLRTLEHAGALVLARKGVYRLGYRLADLGERAARAPRLAALLAPLLEALSERLRESTMATRFVDGEVECIATVDSGRPLFVNVRVGTRLEAYATANGKLWLADLDAGALARYLDSVTLTRIGRNTLTDREALKAELEAVRAQGYARNDSEREDGLRALAVPVRSRTGRLLAGISMFGPDARLGADFDAPALRALHASAAAAAAALYGDRAGTGT